jgi:hypothetical protein
MGGSIQNKVFLWNLPRKCNINVSIMNLNQMNVYLQI